MSINNKVYINPNFNRPTMPENGLSANSSVMHVNPKFTHLLSNVQHNIFNATKIYVNPHFIKLTNVHNNNEGVSIQEKNDDIGHSKKKTTVDFESQTYSDKSIVHTKSRYCLLRQNLNKERTVSVSEMPTNTFKISRYKSIPLKDIKQNLNTIKSPVPKHILNANTLPSSGTIKTQSCPSTSHKTNYRYKIINRNTNENKINGVKSKTITLKTCMQYKKLNRIKRIPKKVNKKNLKKNNIPCPLFRKFGKCLRNMRGKCEFLHDRKHVSVCRKFIAGMCHDKECLLSHDLTKHKMPTCFFYLQGKCVKEDCPYLHVKLNKNAKICPDFLKGFCENGSKCLSRHVNISFTSNNVIKTKSIPKAKDNIGQKMEILTQSAIVKSENTVTINEKNSIVECRYYQDALEKDEQTNDTVCEVIKPTRCKLGTLPSFIQL